MLFAGYRRLIVNEYTCLQCGFASSLNGDAFINVFIVKIGLVRNIGLCYVSEPFFAEPKCPKCNADFKLAAIRVSDDGQAQARAELARLYRRNRKARGVKALVVAPYSRVDFIFDGTSL